MNFVDIYQKYWKNGYTLTDLSLSGIDREVFRSLFNPVAEVFRKYPAGDVHLYIPGVGQVQGLQPENYFDSAGTTLASVDGSVGLVLDAAGSVGANLVTSASGVAGTYNGEKLVDDATNANHYVQLAFASPANRTQITAKVKAGTKPWLWVYFANYPAGSVWFDLANGGVGTQEASVSGKITPLGGGEYEITVTKLNNTASTNGAIVATGANGSTAAYTGTNSVAFYARDISVREITGTHATQATPGYKPTLRKGIVNLLTWSNDLTNAVWITQNSGSATPNSFTFAPNNASQRVQSVSTPSAPVTLAAKVYVASGTKTFKLKVWNGVSDQYSSDLVATTTPQVFILNATGGSSGTPNIAIANGTLGDAGTVIVEGVGLFQGTLTAAQILAAGGIPLTTTAPASSVAGVNYLEFDGVDDRIIASSLNTDTSGLLVVGATPKATGWRMVAGSGAQTGSNAGVRLGIDGGNGQWVFDTASGSGFTHSYSVDVAQINTPVVLSGRWVQGGQQQLRLNSVLKSSGSSVASPSSQGFALGAGQYAAGQGDYFNGNIHCVLAIKGTVSDADLAVLEKFVAQLSGVPL